MLGVVLDESSWLQCSQVMIMGRRVASRLLAVIGGSFSLEYQSHLLSC